MVDGTHNPNVTRKEATQKLAAIISEDIHRPIQEVELVLQTVLVIRDIICQNQPMPTSIAQLEMITAPFFPQSILSLILDTLIATGLFATDGENIYFTNS